MARHAVVITALAGTSRVNRAVLGWAADSLAWSLLICAGMLAFGLYQAVQGEPRALGILLAAVVLLGFPVRFFAKYRAFRKILATG